MKTLKMLALLIIALSFNLNICSAQELADLSDKEKKEMKEELQEYYTALNLTDDQKPKFADITEKYAKKLKGVKKSDKGKIEKYKEMKSIMEAKNNKMAKLLNKYQFTIYLQRQQENKETIKETRKN